MVMIIDAHHHFWDTSKGDYSWMTHVHEPINRVFTPSDLEPLLAKTGVAGSVLVQTWSSREETIDFLELAEHTRFVLGVVGWIDMTSADCGEVLDDLIGRPNGKWLKGIRHQVHDEVDLNWLLRDDVNAALAEIAKRGLVFDLLIKPREIPAALETVARHPSLRFVIDHIAKPNIAADQFDDWASEMSKFAAHKDHVWCKLSGLVTEADWDDPEADQFGRYIRKVVEIFGPSRTMYGSDWPVCTLAASYEDCLEIVKQHLSDLSDEDRNLVLSGSSIAAYGVEIET